MKKTFINLLLVCLLCFSLAFPAVNVFAADNGFEVIFTDITSDDVSTLRGEAKVKVSVKGLTASVTDAQGSFTFSGDLKYKSIEYLQGSDDYSNGNFCIATDADIANNRKAFSAGFVSASPIEFDDVTDLFVITFEGSAGKSATVKLDKAHTFCKANGSVVYASSESALSVYASEKANEAKDATVKLTMDKVPGFMASSSGAGSVITLSLVNERTKAEIKTNITDSYRGSGTVAVYTVTNSVHKDDTYSVELSGNGFKTYYASGVDFNSILEINNSLFVPGDVNKDEDVTADDRAVINSLISNSQYSEAADFNRDGYTDSADLAVLNSVLGASDDNKDEDDSSDQTQPSDKVILPTIAKPTVTGGDKKITVSWTKPTDVSKVKGYVVAYGTSATNLSGKKEIDSSNTTSLTISKLLANTKYYVAVAAKTDSEVGTYSEVAYASTEKETESGNSGGSGGGGSSGGSIGGGGAATMPSITPGISQTPAGEFTDLAGYEWASESIYSLKDKGIISGTSATTYSPSNNIKRGDFILILVRMLGIEGDTANNFADVPVGSYYYDAIAKAKAAGIATGDGINFNPEATITRQDLITLAYRAFLKLGYMKETSDYSSLDEFADKASISDYALSAIVSMVNAGIIKGSDGNVNPLGNATRAEVAVMCKRLADLM